ncbi:MAG: hypothetical protein K6T91_08850 [Firmicutes bacterium]|nr:hypothetical protein [Bacillota bacterium]
MSNESIIKVTILISTVLSLISLVVAVLSGGDIISIITIRFLLVFLASAILSWTAFTIINSVIIKAARESIIELNKELEKEKRLIEEAEKDTLLQEAELLKEELNKGQNLDLTSLPQENIDLDFTEDKENPEIKVFEPFKPRRIETDKDDSSS